MSQRSGEPGAAAFSVAASSDASVAAVADASPLPDEAASRAGAVVASTLFCRPSSVVHLDQPFAWGSCVQGIWDGNEAMVMRAQVIRK